MKIKQLFLSLALIVSAVSCKEEIPVSTEGPQSGSEPAFTLMNSGFFRQ